MDYSQDYFARRLTWRSQDNWVASVFAMGLGRLHSAGPRSENSNTARHLAEFWMIEPEVALADLDDNAELALITSNTSSRRSDYGRRKWNF